MQTLGKYEIIEEIGRGGFAVVSKAREAALKVITGNFTEEAAFVEHFRQNVKCGSVSGGWDHPRRDLRSWRRDLSAGRRREM